MTLTVQSSRPIVDLSRVYPVGVDGEKKAKLITDLPGLLSRLHNPGDRSGLERSDLLEEQAIDYFVMHDLDPLCGFTNDSVSGEGHPETVVVGLWKAHPQTGLYVRVSADHPRNIGLSWDGGWYVGAIYELRLDQIEKGFFKMMNGHHVPLNELANMHSVAVKFQECMEGYMTVAKARRA